MHFLALLYRPPGYLHYPVVDHQFENSPLHCLLLQEVVHVRIYNPVREVFIIVVTSLNVQVLVLVSSLEYLPNPAATSAKRRHSMEELVQNK